jgi:hypothetical protein
MVTQVMDTASFVTCAPRWSNICFYNTLAFILKKISGGKKIKILI